MVYFIFHEVENVPFFLSRSEPSWNNSLLPKNPKHPVFRAADQLILVLNVIT